MSNKTNKINNMKKLALTIAIVFGISLFTYAQTEKAGGLFQYGEVSEDNTSWSKGGSEPLLPALPGHNLFENGNAPLGSGALLLIGFGAAYALKKRKQK